MWYLIIGAVVGIIGIAIFAIQYLPQLKDTAAKVVEVPQIIPMPSMPQLPTEIKIALPKIDFPTITIPEKLFQAPIDFVEKLPSLDDIVKGIKDVTPTWAKDPVGYTLDKTLGEAGRSAEGYFESVGIGIEENITQPLGSLGESLGNVFGDAGKALSNIQLGGGAVTTSEISKRVHRGI